MHRLTCANGDRNCGRDCRFWMKVRDSGAIETDLLKIRPMKLNDPNAEIDSRRLDADSSPGCCDAVHSTAEPSLYCQPFR